MKTKNTSHSAARTGKIARLPHAIREQINRRLRDGQQAEPLLQWLNSLSEVRAVLDEDFEGRPISPQNLSEWRTGGYCDWQVRQDALDLATNLEDQHALGHKALQGPFTAKLAHWLTLRFAAAAQNLASTVQDPQKLWTRMRELCSDIARLRRGDLHAERLRIERAWLAFEQTNARWRKKEEFLAWSKRRNARKKLRSKPGGISEKTLRRIERELHLM